MSETKFTQGPWVIQNGYANHIYIIPAEDAGKLAGASFVSEEEHRREFFRQVAMINRRHFKFDGISQQEHEANIRLMAASPDLYAACVALQMEAAARGCGLRIADEAIAKANGESR